MPLYDYACTQCGRVQEVRHGFGESYDRPCEECGGALKRVFNPAPVLFKGSGFYVTDSRRSASSGKAEKPKDDTPAVKAKEETPAAKSETPKPKSETPPAA